ncbi:MAG: flavin reductase family protein [Gemmatimonadota bacterium]
MPVDGGSERRSSRILDTESLSSRARYDLLTSLVVPRPIGWISTASAARVPNLAPYSFFAALSASPMLVGIAIGARRGGALKDSLSNLRARPWFCVNVVTVDQLERMNRTAADLPPETSEFDFGGSALSWPTDVEAPFVADCPAVLVCRLEREIGLEPSTSTLVIGRVTEVRLDPDLELEPDSYRVSPRALPVVGRLGGNAYVLPGPIQELARPDGRGG